MPDTLDMGDKSQSEKKLKKEALPKKCPRCHYMKPAKVHKCPKCGCEPEKQPTIETEDGELVIINKKKYTLEDKARWYAQLKSYGKNRGYSSGWSANQYKHKFKVWPNHPSIRYVEPEETSMEVYNYIKYKQRKYAKMKRKERV